MKYMFEQEIALIKDETLRDIVRGYMQTCVPSYFWDVGASSSRKFHPGFSQGKGGLVRHTQAVVMFLAELLRMSSYSYMPDNYKDYAIAAAIMHDTCKYGRYEYDKDEYKSHAANAAEHFANFYAYTLDGPEPPYLLTHAMISHMGQWTVEPEDKPLTNIDRVVHLADYMASRNFIDIPVLSPGKAPSIQGKEFEDVF